MKPIENPVNFRDLGGIRAAGGKTVAPCRLLRAGEPAGLSESERSALLHDYHLRCILDLRSAHEDKNRPDDTLPGVRYVPVDIMKNVEGQVPDPDTFLAKLKTPADAEKFMLDVYELMIKDAAAQAGFREVVQILLAQQEGATLFHCSAGKDRTGLAAAIILTILGASQADIMADYLKTNDMRREANAGIVAVLQKRGISQAHVAAVEIALNVEAAYLERSYAAAKELFGSFENYLSQGLGVTPDMTARLRAMYLD